MQAVYKGAGGHTFPFQDANNELVAYLRQNVYSFAAAKSLTEMQLWNDLLIDNNGKRRPFTDFRNEVTKTGTIFNINHLKAEYDTALTSVQTVQTWNEFSDDEYLQWSTAGDDRVCPQCAPLDGFTAKKSDSVWRRLFVPIHFNCHCRLIPGEHKNVKPFKTADILENSKIQKYFQRNTAIDKLIYKDDLPYYQNSFMKEKKLRYDANYNMPGIKKIYADNWPDAKTLPDRPAANQWWKEQAGKIKGSFDAKDVFGNTLRFDDRFRNHVFEDNPDKRFEFLNNVKDIIQDPDEVWSVLNDEGKLETTYIKYYEGFPYNVQVNGVRPFTMTKYNISGTEEVNEQSVNRDRSGTLLYRNTIKK